MKSRLLFCLLLFLGLAFAAPAATITVTSGADSGPGTLRQALADSAVGGTITFAPSVTVVTVTATLNVNQGVTLQGPGATQLLITGNHSADQSGGNGFGPIFITNSGVVNVSGITIGNNAPPFGNIVASFDNVAATLNLTDCVISGNSPSGTTFGLGLFNEPQGTLNVLRCSITGHHSTHRVTGGGIYNYGGIVTVTDSDISNNTALNGPTNGLGLCNSNGGTMTVTNCSMCNNVTTHTGLSFIIGYSAGMGVANLAANSPLPTSRLSLINSTISGNVKPPGHSLTRIWRRTSSSLISEDTAMRKSDCRPMRCAPSLSASPAPSCGAKNRTAGRSGIGSYTPLPCGRAESVRS